MSPTHSPNRRQFLTYGLGGIVAVGAIGTATVGSITSASGGNDLRSSLTIIAPAAAGGGWDTVAREMQQAQRANGIVNNTQVVNIPGAGGTIALGNMEILAGKANNLMVGGTGQLAATIQYDSATTYADVNPLAVLVEEYDVIAVAANSPYKNLKDLMSAWAEEPGKVPWTGGGSFDQLVVADMALKAGLSPKDMIYVSSDGGGESTQALLNGTAAAAASGYPDTIDQVESGRLRALAIVAKEPVPGVDIPTTVEQGYQVTLANWRLVVAPGGITEDEKSELETIVQETIHTPQWRDAIERFYWNENVITGADLSRFLDEEKKRIQGLYKELGL
ncbi:tricarboxylic transport membrane protein [Kocuria varians]|uniref:Tricarboxylic transport membrane protein n=1 Tax=Kocuria varians TaxID=1272 RepID=A0A4Y4D5S4_KOCVA|nr:tripartite tricarboxylate transporter substrate-binding protein [Kocuria varians]GEC98913.1 tricarboxylic transport membrane protein [Kocuria varians]